MPVVPLDCRINHRQPYRIDLCAASTARTYSALQGGGRACGCGVVRVRAGAAASVLACVPAPRLRPLAGTPPRLRPAWGAPFSCDVNYRRVPQHWLDTAEVGHSTQSGVSLMRTTGHT